MGEVTMKNVTIRPLKASEIEARVKTWDKTKQSWAMILLYKDARCDQRLMDETFGMMNWKRDHQIIDGNLYCTVSVWNETTGQWVSKQDVGTESDTEKEKGQASDSFKRACFNWGIGRELYTAPRICINTTPADYRNGSFVTRLSVSEIAYNDNKEIIRLILVDERTGAERYRYTAPQQTAAQSQPIQQAAKTLSDNGIKVDVLDDNLVDMLLKKVAESKTMDDLKYVLQFKDTPEYNSIRTTILKKGQQLKNS